MTHRGSLIALALLLAGGGAEAGTDEKTEYNRRAAAGFVSLFQSLDRDADGAVTRAESQGDLNFSPRFDDMDINRDGVVTQDELRRFLLQQHGVELEALR